MIRKSKGFGIIELMVSILIASIVIAGMYKLLTSSALNFGISSASSRSGKSYRQVDNMLNNLLFQTGFINYRRVAKNEELVEVDSKFEPPFNDKWQESEYVTGFSETNGNDAVRIRFWGSSINDDTAVETGGAEANGFIFDCRGVPVPNTIMMEMLIRVVPGQGLTCSQHVLSNAGTTGFDDVDAQVIDRSIVSIRFLYGSTYFTTNASSDANTMHFADDIGGTNMPEWTDVNVVKYSMITSQETGQRAVGAQPTLTLFTAAESPNGSAIEYTVANNEQFNMHRVLSGSISFVNANNFD